MYENDDSLCKNGKKHDCSLFTVKNLNSTPILITQTTADIPLRSSS